jgi:WD40 repeat protein
VAFSPDGRSILTGCEDGAARLWETATGRPLTAPLTHRGPVVAVTFSPDGRTALTGGEDGTARLWDAATGRPLGTPFAHDAPVTRLAYSPDGRTILVVTDDKKARLWDVAELPDDLPRVGDWVESLTGMALDPSGSLQPLGHNAWQQLRSRLGGWTGSE